MDAENQQLPNQHSQDELQRPHDVEEYALAGQNRKAAKGTSSDVAAPQTRRKVKEYRSQEEEEEAAKNAIRAERARVRAARKRRERSEECNEDTKEELKTARVALDVKTSTQLPVRTGSEDRSTTDFSATKTKSRAENMSASKSNVKSMALTAEIRPPKVLLKVVDVEVAAGKPLDLVLSTNLVIRTVSKYSIAFYSVIVGDQILEINDVAPMGVPEFLSIMHAEQNTLKLSILRAWNIYPATESRMAWVKKQDNFAYFIVEVHRFKNFRNGFDVKFVNKQCHVTKVESNSRGGHAFLKGDRLLDVDSIPITGSTDLKFVRRHFNKVMAKDRKCTFLVERANSLRSSPNPSAFALTREAYEVEMGEDATEIGCRESMRHLLLHKKYRPISILAGHTCKTIETACEDEENVRGDRCVNFDVNSTSSHLLHLLSSSSMKGVEAKKRWQQLQSSKVLPERTPLPSTLSTAASLVSREEARCSMKDSDVLEDDYHLQPYHEARANFFNGTLSAPSPRLEKSVVLMGSPCLRFTQVPNSPQPESKGNTGRTELSHYDSNTHRFERLRIEEEPPTQTELSEHPFAFPLVYAGNEIKDKVRRRRRAKRSQNKKIAIDTRIETLRMPSDVKDESVLQKVTPRSGLISFVKSVMSR